jgi:hypothetical protein
MKPYRYEMWICERCNIQGTSEVEARQHFTHPAGWKLHGNTHPRSRFPEFYGSKWSHFPLDSHPDVIPGFYWTVDWTALQADRTTRRALAGSERAVFQGQAAS